MIYPAKVIAYTGDQVTFNRSAETGVERGQVWEVMHAGETLVDPDTGEVLGQEETSIGWVEVTDTTANFSKARVIQDRGIQRGDILRFRPSGLPSEIGRTGPQPPRSEQGAGPTRAPGAPPPRAPAGSGVAPTPPQRDPGAGPAERGAAEELGAPLKAAIFVKNRAHTDRPTTTNPGVDDSKVMVLEDYLVDTLTSAGLQVIAREDVITAVSQFASEGANAGTNEPGADRLDRILSDSTSAKALAATLGADALVLASITSLTRDSQRFGDPSIGVESSVTTWSLDVTYRIVDGATGASQDAGTATSQEPVRQSPNLQNDTDPTDRLLRENAGKVGQSVRRALERNRVRPSTAAAETGIEIRVSMADMTIPEISKDPQSGEYVVGAARYQLEATAVSVLVDGMLVGTAPGTFQIGPGVHRIRLERALFEPVEQIVNVRAETTLNLAMKLTVEGLERWRAQGLVLEELKDKQVLRDVALERAKAMAEFLRQSHIRIDTRNVRTLVTGTNFLWPVGR